MVGRSGRRPWWIWIVPAVALYTVLAWRNSFLFSTSLYEQGDSAANSVLVQQALRGTLLVGHYSREGFNHPGPAYLYVQAFGQWLTHDVLHLVPTPWNGQFLAIWALNSAMAAMAVAIVYGWTRRLPAAAAAFAVVVGLITNYPLVGVAVWPPDEFVLTYLVFMLAAASLAARRTDSLWILALSGWMLMHGYAPLLLFVPLVTAVAAIIALWPDRRRPRAAIGEFLRSRVWLPALVISVVFLLPIVLNLMLHWPGQFGHYFSYSNSAKAGGHTMRQVLGFVGWYWWPNSTTWRYSMIAVALGMVAFVIAGRRVAWRYFVPLLVIAGVTTLAFGLYAAKGADVLTNHYIGYFYWSVPFAVILVVVVGAAQAVPAGRVSDIAAMAGAVAVLAALAFGVIIRTDVHDNNPAIPGTVAALAARSHGRVSVLTVQDAAWPEVIGVLLQAQRSGVPACVTNPSGAYRVMAGRFVCTAADRLQGLAYTVSGPQGPYLSMRP